MFPYSVFGYLDGATVPRVLQRSSTVAEHRCVCDGQIVSTAHNQSINLALAHQFLLVQAIAHTTGLSEESEN